VTIVDSIDLVDQSTLTIRKIVIRDGEDQVDESTALSAPDYVWFRDRADSTIYKLTIEDGVITVDVGDPGIEDVNELILIRDERTSEVWDYAVWDGETRLLTVVLVSPTGLAADGAVGTVTVTGTALVSPSGISADGEMGEVTVTATSGGVSVVVTVSGLSAVGAIGQAAVSAAQLTEGGGLIWGFFPKRTKPKPVNARIRVSGIAAVGAVGRVSVSTTAAVMLGGGSGGSASAGLVNVRGNAIVRTVGLSSYGYRPRVGVRTIQNPTEDDLMAILELL
jgi:hypothetical protein